MSTDRQLDKEDVVHTDNGILLSQWNITLFYYYKKEQNLAIFNIDVEGIMLSEINKRKTNTT